MTKKGKSMLDRWEDDKKMFEEQAPKESKEIIKKREDDFY